MTQDEIIEMAMQAEFVSRARSTDEESELFVCVDKDIVRFAKLVAAKATEEALAQPEQEPVAWFSPLGNLYKTRFHATANGEQVITPLYTTPQRTWVGLTDEEIAKEFYKFEAAGAWYQFARAIEAKLKEKNT